MTAATTRVLDLLHSSVRNAQRASLRNRVDYVAKDNAR